MTLKPETVFKSTLAKVIYAAAAIFGAGWWLNEQKNSIVNEVASAKSATVALEAKINSVEKKLDNQFVTWPIARLYASETRRANAQLPLFLPDLDDYQKANKPN